jgi:hypothetical protein
MTVGPTYRITNLHGILDKRVRSSEHKMLIHLPIIILTSLHPTPIADAVPKFEIARECQFEGGLKDDLNRCVTDETQAREQLQTKWKQFTPSEKNVCTQEADTDGISSYVELQICLEMERDVKQAEVRKM